MSRMAQFKFNRSVRRLHKQGVSNLVELFDTIKYIEQIPQY